MHTPVPPDHPLDPALAARLERLSARSGPPNAGSVSPAARPPRRRRHAAKRARTAALALSLSTAAGLTYAFAAMDGSTTTAAAQSAGIVGASGTPLSGSGRTGGLVDKGSDPTAPTATVPTSAASTTLVNGAVYQNKFGNVQVQVEFAPDGSIVDAGTLQTPNQDGKSVRINDRAVPALTSEALAAQSAQVHSVSGATYTSHDYQRSLQSAIDAARASGITQIA